MMRNKNQSLLYLLLDREIGYTNKLNNRYLTDLSVDLAETQLVNNFRIQDITNVSPAIRSSYVISCNSEGHAAISHTNRTVSIVDTKRMRKIGEIQSSDRTIWTIAYHPRILSLLATGSVGGLVTVYKDYVLQATIQEQNGNAIHYGNIIPSVCFHPLHDFVAYSSRKEVKIWDWKNNTILYNLSGNSTTRYMKFNPLNNMLITIQTYKQYDSHSCIHNIFNVIAAIGLVLNSALEPCYIKDDINFFSQKLRNLSFKCSLQCDSQSVLEEKSFDRILQDLDTTIKIWHRKLENFTPHKLVAEHEIRCEHFFKQIRNYLKHCNKIRDDFKERLINCLNMGKLPITVAIKLCLCSSKKLLEEYLRQKCADEDILDYPEESAYLVAPKILQVWDFDTTPDLNHNWYGSIGQCESHNDVSADVSNCGRKVAVFYRKLDNEHNNYSRLRVFSLEKFNLGQLLHNIQPNLCCMEEFMGVTFSPSSNYLIMAIRRNLEEHQSRISVHRLGGSEYLNVAEQSPVLIDRNVGFVKWAPYPGDSILLGFSTHNLSYWRCS